MDFFYFSKDSQIDKFGYDHDSNNCCILTVSRKQLRCDKDVFGDMWSSNPEQYNTRMMYGREVKEGRMNRLFATDPSVKYVDGKSRSQSDGSIDDYKLLKIVYKDAKSHFPTINFNAVFVNYYNDGDDYIGAHSDDTTRLSPGAPILSYSFYENPHHERDFGINNKKNHLIGKFPLGHGDMAIMCPNFQNVVKHSVPVRKRDKCRRINFTVRSYVER